MRQLSGVEAKVEQSPTLLAAMGESGNNKPCVAYTMKIRSGVAVDSNGKAAGKGALVQTEKAGTLSTVQDQYLFQPTAIIDNIGGQAEYGKVTGINGTLRAGGQGAIAYAVENHHTPMLASGKDVAGCLMASGYEKLGAQEMFSGDYTVIEQKPTIGLNGETDKAPTLIARMSSAVGTTQDNLLVCMTPPVYCLQGNGIDRADTAGCNGKGWKEDTCYTLNTIDRPAVSYQKTIGTLCAADQKGVGNQYVADDKCIVEPKGATSYIVRRLTPTECARLQGFADRWGDVLAVDSLTDEEYRFWLEVRNTHARINGRAEKDYTPKQMLTWYNKLQTDSAEYKMWGNGIALPPALYCLQGMADALNKAADDWMN